MKIELNEELRELNEARHDQKLSLADCRAHRRKIIENLQMNSLGIDNLMIQESAELLESTKESTKEKRSPVKMIVLFSILIVVTVWLVN